jgi:hypothetical protein
MSPDPFQVLHGYVIQFGQLYHKRTPLFSVRTCRLILYLQFISPAISTVAIGVVPREGSQARGPRDEMRR